MKTVAEIQKLKQDCLDRIRTIRADRSLEKSVAKRRENKESSEIEYLDSIKALLDCGYTENDITQWRERLEQKLNIISKATPEFSEYDTEDTHKKKVQEHNKAYGVAKIKSQISNIDFILN